MAEQLDDKSFSLASLKNYRQFYLYYPEIARPIADYLQRKTQKSQSLISLFQQQGNQRLIKSQSLKSTPHYHFWHGILVADSRHILAALLLSEVVHKYLLNATKKVNRCAETRNDFFLYFPSIGKNFAGIVCEFCCTKACWH